MSKKVLIITNSADLHADLFLPIALSKGHQPFRLDLDAFPRDYQISQQCINGHVSNMIRQMPDGQWLDLSEIGAIWVRKPGEFAYLSDDLSLQERAYAKLETEQALFSLLYTLDCYWMSHPLALRGAQWKGEQLMRAMRMGFRVPSSIVTNSPDQVRSFQRAIDGAMIFKAMSTPTLAADTLEQEDRICNGLPTTLVDEEMMENLDAVGELPCQFQQYIPKQYELRVTVIGERVFAAKIDSQADPRTAVDSRNMSAEISFEACTLPADIEQRCLDFVHSYNLHYGAIDLIVTPDEQYVFLENNPAGQFLYIEQLIPEYKMLEAIADKLIEEAQCHK